MSWQFAVGSWQKETINGLILYWKLLFVLQMQTI
jgi:hypothetical protein